MSGSKVQRDFYEYPNEPPTPVGYISGPALLNDLLLVWWGERAHLEPATLFGHEAGWETDLGTLEQEGQILIAIEKISADAQTIKFLVASEDSDALQPADCVLLNHGLRTGLNRSGFAGGSKP